MIIEVQAELERQDRTVAWLARRCDLHPSYVLRMLKGERPITEEFKTAAAEVLGVPQDRLFPDIPPEAATPTDQERALAKAEAAS